MFYVILFFISFSLVSLCVSVCFTGQVEAVWRQQLGATAPVSVVVSFFDLGGDR